MGVEVTHLEQLASVSRCLGEDIYLVQGPGGNTSLKDGNRLWVKSSGVLLKDVSPEIGFSEVVLDRCVKLLPSVQNRIPTAEDESRYVASIQESAVDPTKPRASMELGFHAGIPSKWILHVHSLAGIILGVISNTPIASRLFKPILQSGFTMIKVSPAIPGLHLTWKMLNAYKKAVIASEIATSRPSGAPRNDEIATANEAPILWLLENHGLVWSGGDVELLGDVARKFEEDARRGLGFEEFPFPKIKDGSLNFSGWGDFYLDSEPLFPDYTVFFPDPKNRPIVDGKLVRLPSGFSKDRRQFGFELIFAQALVGTILKSFSALKQAMS